VHPLIALPPCAANPRARALPHALLLVSSAPTCVLNARPCVLQLHIGLGEVLVAENAIFAQRLSANGGACELHMYDAMWHVFPMYYEGCEHPVKVRLDLT
jgi:acetyl esterase/lipase